MKNLKIFSKFSKYSTNNFYRTNNIIYYFCKKEKNNKNIIITKEEDKAKSKYLIINFNDKR
jgi:hypothetical protein